MIYTRNVGFQYIHYCSYYVSITKISLLTESLSAMKSQQNIGQQTEAVYTFMQSSDLKNHLVLNSNYRSAISYEIATK